MVKRRQKLALDLYTDGTYRKLRTKRQKASEPSEPKEGSSEAVSCSGLWRRDCLSYADYPRSLGVRDGDGFRKVFIEHVDVLPRLLSVTRKELFLSDSEGQQYEVSPVELVCCGRDASTAYLAEQAALSNQTSMLVIAQDSAAAEVLAERLVEQLGPVDVVRNEGRLELQWQTEESGEASTGKSSQAGRRNLSVVCAEVAGDLRSEGEASVFIVGIPSLREVLTSCLDRFPGAVVLLPRVSRFWSLEEKRLEQLFLEALEMDDFTDMDKAAGADKHEMDVLLALLAREVEALDQGNVGYLAAPISGAMQKLTDQDWELLQREGFERHSDEKSAKKALNRFLAMLRDHSDADLLGSYLHLHKIVVGLMHICGKQGVQACLVDLMNAVGQYQGFRKQLQSSFLKMRWELNFRDYEQAGKRGGGAYINQRGLAQTEEFKHLIPWMTEQKGLLVCDGKTAEERREKLESILFDFESNKFPYFDKKLEKLRAFVEKEGHFNPPIDSELGIWLNNCRRQRRRNGTPDWQATRFASLEADLNKAIEWNPLKSTQFYVRARGSLLAERAEYEWSRQRLWPSWLAELQTRHAAGQSVNLAYSDGPLGVYCYSLRKRHKDGKVSTEWRKSLEALGFDFKLDTKTERREEMLSKLEAFYEENGHSDVSSSRHDGLAFFVINLRCGGVTITPDVRERLEAVNFKGLCAPGEALPAEAKKTFKDFEEKVEGLKLTMGGGSISGNLPPDWEHRRDGRESRVLSEQEEGERCAHLTLKKCRTGFSKLVMEYVIHRMSTVERDALIRNGFLWSEQDVENLLVLDKELLLAKAGSSTHQQAATPPTKRKTGPTLTSSIAMREAQLKHLHKEGIVLMCSDPRAFLERVLEWKEHGGRTELWSDIAKSFKKGHPFFTWLYKTHRDRKAILAGKNVKSKSWKYAILMQEGLSSILSSNEKDSGKKKTRGPGSKGSLKAKLRRK